MFSTSLTLYKSARVTCSPSRVSIFSRCLSTPAAIRKGLRRSEKSPLSRARKPTALVTAPYRRHVDRNDVARSPRRDVHARTQKRRRFGNEGDASGRSSQRATDSQRYDSSEPIPPKERLQGLRQRASGIETDSRRQGNIGNRGGSSFVPKSIPYTTPASEFLYGTSVVESALASDRRKLYKLYVYCGEQRLRGSQDEKLSKLAKRKGVPVAMVKTGAWLSILDKMSKGRPHNGYCLEASPLKRPLVSALMAVEQGAPGQAGRFRVKTENMSSEDRDINGYDEEIRIQSIDHRQPFVLLLDGVVDVGNLGGILRSAYFLGADAVVISRSCAPLNPIVLKASAGAAEVVPMLSVGDTTGFLERSKAAGWKVFASVAPPTSNRRREASAGERHVTLETLGSPLRDYPCILMMGGEGDGLKPDLQNRANHTVSISSQRSNRSTVDSLNVSVAAGIMMESFLRPTIAHRPADGKGLW